MKYIKILGLIFGVVIAVIIIDYSRIIVSYNLNKEKYIECFDVQGNNGKYVPQGLAYSDKYNIILQTSYNKKHKVSKIYLTEFSTGKFIKEIELLRNDGSENFSHVGGIATNNDIVWITSDYEINEYSLEEIINTNQNRIKSQKDTKLSNRGDFCTYNENILWIGEFFLKGIYEVPDKNPLIMGFSIKENIDFSNPDYIISIPKMIQGIAITPDNKFIFTKSYSNFRKSELFIYNNVLNSKSDYYELNGKKIPYYKFSKENLEKNIKLPPMAEGLFYKDDSLYILFESSSDNYFTAYPKIDKIIKFKY